MAGAMAIIMLLFMLGMYKNKLLNISIVVASSLIIIVALFLVRSQNTVDDISWMKAMIPHHSIAILTSERANISNPRVLDLAERIIETQRKEIEEMKELIKELKNEQALLP